MNRLFKKVLIALLVVAVTSISVAATFILKGDLKIIDGIFYFQHGGEDVEIKEDHVETTPNGLEREVYLDNDGNEYRFGEENHFLGIIYNPQVIENNELNENNVDSYDTISDDDAIAAATEIGHAQFEEEFDKLTFRDVTVDGSGGKTVRFWELLGEDGFIIGNSFYATFRKEGTLVAYGMPKNDDLKDFDESLLDGITFEWLVSDIEKKTVSLYGDKLVGWYFAVDGKVSLEKSKSGYILSAPVMSEVHYDSGDFDDGGMIYQYQLPFDHQTGNS